MITDLINNRLQQCKNYSNSVFLQAEATEGQMIFIQPRKADQFPCYMLYRDGKLIIPECYEDKTFYFPPIHIAVLNEPEMLQII